MKNPLVSVIIPNYNGMAFLGQCLKSLNDQTFDDFEIILVDDVSKDDSVEFIREHFPKVKIVINKENLGFPKTCNIGIKLCRGKYVALLNNDTVVDKKWLEALVETIENNAAVGMCASKILSMGSVALIDSVGINICFDGMSRGRGRLENDIGQYSTTEEVLLPSGCAALYRKKMLDEIGVFDEDFFSYCEDTDMGLRGQLAGWKSFLVPEAIVYHHYSGSWKKNILKKIYLIERNHVWLAIKIFPVELLLIFPILTFYRFILQFYAAIKKRGATSEFLIQLSPWVVIRTIFSAYFDALIKIPLFIKKRTIIQKNKKLSRTEFYLLLKKHKLNFKELVYKK